MNGPDRGVVKRSISIAGHRTSISLEGPFWTALVAIARERGVAIQALVGEIDAGRGGQNLSSAIRIFVLADAQSRSAGPGPDRADLPLPRRGPS